MRFGCFIILCNTLSSLFSQSVWPYGFTKKDLEGSSIGIQIRDFKTDSVIYEYDADRILVPASIQKILSTYFLNWITLYQPTQIVTQEMYDSNKKGTGKLYDQVYNYVQQNNYFLTNLREYPLA